MTDTGACTNVDYNKIKSCCNTSEKAQYVCTASFAIGGCSDGPWDPNACSQYCLAAVGSQCPIIPARNRTFTMVNNTSSTVWVAMITGVVNNEIPPTKNRTMTTQPIVFPDGTVGGYALAANTQVVLDNVPYNWSGRIWGRTYCGYYPKGSPNCDHGSTGPAQCFYCEAGDCGSADNQWGLGCILTGGEAPATLAEFTLYGGGYMDYYDVSYVDGANLQVTIQAVGPAQTPWNPQGGTGFGCVPGQVVGVMQDAIVCPSEVQLLNNNNIIGCYSICKAVSNPAVRNARERQEVMLIQLISNGIIVILLIGM